MILPNGCNKQLGDCFSTILLSLVPDHHWQSVIGDIIQCSILANIMFEVCFNHGLSTIGYWLISHYLWDLTYLFQLLIPFIHLFICSFLPSSTHSLIHSVICDSLWNVKPCLLVHGSTPDCEEPQHVKLQKWSVFEPRRAIAVAIHCWLSSDYKCLPFNLLINRHWTLLAIVHPIIKRFIKHIIYY